MVLIRDDVRLESLDKEKLKVFSARCLLGSFQEFNVGVEARRRREAQRFWGNLDLEVRSHNGLEAVGAFVVHDIEVVLQQLQHACL